MQALPLCFIFLTLVFEAVLSKKTDRNEVWYICPTDTGTCEDIDCDLDQGNQRAGYTCDQFPFYSGGFGETEWNDEDEAYRCQEAFTNGTEFACRHWTATEIDGITLEAGECECLKTKDNAYCDEWVCYQVEGESSAITWTECDTIKAVNPAADAISEVTKYCPSGADTTIEALFCFCFAGSSQQYCAEWFCDQYDILTDGEFDPVETEVYQCDQDNGRYCTQWQGDINSDYEFELASCNCVQESESGLYCSDWECYEKGMDKLQLEDSGFLSGVLSSCICSVALLALPLVLKKQCSPKNRRCVFCTIFITFTAFGCVALFVGGLAAFLIWFVVWLAAFQFFWVFRPTRNCLAYDEICGCNLCGLLANQAEVDARRITNGGTAGGTADTTSPGGPGSEDYTPGATGPDQMNQVPQQQQMPQQPAMNYMAQQSNSAYSPQQFAQQPQQQLSPQQQPQYGQYGRHSQDQYYSPPQQPVAPQQAYGQAPPQQQPYAPSVPMQDMSSAPPQAYGGGAAPVAPGGGGEGGGPGGQGTGQRASMMSNGSNPGNPYY